MTFQKGNKYGKGRPKKPEIELLRKAMAKAKSEHGGIGLLEHAVSIAYKDSTVLVALLRKVLPDLRNVESKVEHINDKSLTDEQVCEILHIRPITKDTADALAG